MKDSITLQNSIMPQKTSNPSARIVWLDVCKGLLIISVILGHISGIPSVLRKIIFSFHMPLFFAINGYLLRDYNIGKTFTKSVKSLMKPYLVVCVLQAMLAAWNQSGFPEAGTMFFQGLNDMIVGMSKISTVFTAFHSVCLVWFVICLFTSRNLYVLIRNITGSRLIQDMIIVAVTFVGCYIQKAIGYLPWSIDVAMSALVFVAAGDLLSKCNLKKPVEVVLFVAASAIWVYLLSKNAQLELATRRYPLDILCFICALAGSYVFVSICKVFAAIPVFSQVWAWLGKNSMLILSVHCLEMRFFKWTEWVYVPMNLTPGWLLAFAIHTVLILLAVLSFKLIRAGLGKLNTSLKNRKPDNSARMEWPDVAKGICIISVILGHLGSQWLNRIVFVYHLPVFFLISGYFLKKKEDEKQYIKEKARRLLVPYAVTCIIVISIAVIQTVYAGGSIQGTLTKWLAASLYGAGNNWQTPIQVTKIGAIWFLWALFFANIIVHHFVEKKYYQAIIIGIAFVGWSTFDQTGVWLPLSIQAGMLASLYLLVGYEAKKNHFEIRKIGPVPLFSLFLIAAFGIQHFKGIWLVHNYFGNGWLDFFTSLAASVVVIAASQYICNVSEWLKRVLMFLGRNSLILLCAHLVDLNVLSRYIISFSATVSGALALNDNHAFVLLSLIRIIYATLALLLVSAIKRFVWWGIHARA